MMWFKRYVGGMEKGIVCKKQDLTLCFKNLIFVFFITVFGSPLVYAATEIGSFYDHSGNLWTAVTDASLIDGEPYLENPKAYLDDVRFQKNGIEEYANKEIQGLYLKSVGLKFDIGVTPIGTLGGGDEFISDKSYWAVGCGYTIGCQLAKIDFDNSERQIIYEGLLYNAVTSADLPFLLGESYVLLKDGTNLYQDLVINLSFLINNLCHNAKYFIHNGSCNKSGIS